MRSFVAAMLLLILSLPASAQVYTGPQLPGGYTGPATTRAGERVTMSGIVVNALTNQPISHAVVQLFAERSRAVFTDSQGKFSFSDVPEGRYRLNPVKPGYMNVIEASSSMSRSLSFEASAKAPEAVVKLWPMGKIRIHVVDAAGEPLEGVNIEALGEVIAGGRKQPVNVQTAVTDDDGAAVVGNLRPGSYRVAAAPQQRVVAQRKGVTLAYAGKTYYPDAREPDSAAQLAMSPGQERQLEMTVAPQPVFRVAGTVQPPGIGGLQLRIGEDYANTFIQVDRYSGRFVIPQVPAGRYTLEATDNNPPNGLMHAETTIVVEKDMEGVVVPVQSALTIPVEVRTEFSGKLPQLPGAGPVIYTGAMGTRRDQMPLTMYLEPTQRGRAVYGGSLQQKEDGSLVIPNVLPGHYRMRFQPYGGAYVASARYGEQDLLKQDLAIVGDSPDRIEITLRDEYGTIVLKPPDGVTSAAYILVCESEPKRELHVISGAGQVPQPPGTYDIYAFEDLDGLEWANPEALAPYSSKAARITIGPDEQATVTPQLIQRETK